MTETFGERLRRLRRERGWSASVLATKAGDKSAVSRWENDLRKPEPAELVRLAHLLKVSPHHLETGEKEEPSIEALQWISRVSLSDVARLHNAMRAGEKQEVLLAMVGDAGR